jgi:hypothetical protein
MTVPKYANFSKLPLELGPEFIHGERQVTGRAACCLAD